MDDGIQASPNIRGTAWKAGVILTRGNLGSKKIPSETDFVPANSMIDAADNAIRRRRRFLLDFPPLPNQDGIILRSFLRSERQYPITHAERVCQGLRAERLHLITPLPSTGTHFYSPVADGEIFRESILQLCRLRLLRPISPESADRPEQWVSAGRTDPVRSFPGRCPNSDTPWPRCPRVERADP